MNAQKEFCSLILLWLLMYQTLYPQTPVEITGLHPLPACRASLVEVRGQGFAGQPLALHGQSLSPVFHSDSLILFQIPNLPVNDSLALSVGNAVDSLWIADAEPSFSVPASLCQGERLLHSGVQPVGGTWNYGGGFSFQFGVGQVATAPAGIYPVSYSVLNAAGCTDSLTVWIQIEARDSAGFYFADTLYCTQSPDPLPVLTGDGGGHFFDYSLSGLVIDSLSGRVDLNGSAWFSHLAGYVTGGNCLDTATTLLRIFPQGDADFSYPFTSYCLASTQIPVPLRNDTNGVFADPSGRVTFLDSTTGAINLSASLPGDSIAVVHYVPGIYGGCPDTAVFFLSLLAPDTSISIRYLDSLFCPSDSNPVPVITGPSGGYFSALPGGLVFSDPQSGAINLNLSAPNSYRISYRVQNLCSDTTTDFLLTLAETTPADFILTDSATCENAPDPLLIPSALGGTFSGGVFNGDSLDLSATGAGTHPISYTSSGACPETVTKTLRIHPAPSPILVAQSGVNFCEGDSAAVLLLGGNPNDEKIFVLEGEERQRGSNERFQTDEGGLLLATLTNAFGCFESDSLQLSKILRPRIVQAEFPEVISEKTSLKIHLRSDRDSTRYLWSFTGSGPVDPDSGSRCTGFASPDSLSTLSERFLLTKSSDPVSLSFSVRSFTGENCFGDSLAFAVDVIAQADRVFLPELVTPNGDGLNDQWNILLPDNENPSDYRLLLFSDPGGRVLDLSRLRSPVELSHLPDGVYWWTLHKQGQIIRKGGLSILTH